MVITYNDIYEALRKEKYNEQLQPIAKGFVKEVSAYLKDKEKSSAGGDLFSSEAKKVKRKLEETASIFKEILRIRKRKLLDLAFVSIETGVSRRDFENMFSFEKEIFDKIMKALHEGDKVVEQLLGGEDVEEKQGIKHKLVIFKQATEEFLDLEGNKLGPFAEGDIVNLPQEIAQILLADGKADAVDEE